MDSPLKYINELKGITFHIDKYQRGYRWGIREIFSLLDDISSFDNKKESFYCLQPLVLRKKQAYTFELIDGQQRSTTIYLILKFLLKENFYHLKYETRGGDDGYNFFLESIDSYDLPDFSDLDEASLDKNISNFWKNDFVVTIIAILLDLLDKIFLFRLSA